MNGVVTHFQKNIALHQRTTCKTKPVTETVSRHRTTPQVMVVPVTVEEAPETKTPPPKLERHTNQKHRFTRETVAEDEVAEYDKGVNEPAAPIAPAVMKPLKRVDQFRLLARNGLPS